MNLRVKIKRVKDVKLPKYAKPGDSGFDLVAAEDVILWPGETNVIKTGLSFEIPPGYEMTVRPRSGISRRTMIHVALGTIDSGFRGEVGVITKNLKQPVLEKRKDEEGEYSEPEYSDVLFDIEEKFVKCNDHHPEGSYYIRKGDRIAQGVIAPVETAHFVEVDKLSVSERGAGGFGSTGVK
ncbi:deoxyuridine 5'-triphosphate nucleotidohydrolase [Bacillus wiedmannii]|uniref:dUTP diphosphatase n=1 Tax=Bacillus wiedmannii TaxID=1890302 RepID=UPI000BF7FCC7|nr:deoxyuridine 5'-triphosphate nucleotidohydrolase [Bacillus wiedmannii]PEU21539.1 deoxyuridine 5'-triphosphate nucleotidohydrolase [Bacillus wiedmannii]